MFGYIKNSFKKITINSVKDVLIKIVPYIIILAASFLPFVIFFQIGGSITKGDDNPWHLIWVFDLESGFSTNGISISPSHNLFGNLGVGIYLFYGGLSHYIVAIIHHIFPGITIITSWKIVIISTTFLMGVWTYWLGKKITKNTCCSLMIALVMVFNPYRIENIFYRMAFPEAIAISFLPLLFLGVYELGHKDYRAICFVHCIVGVFALIYTHPFTGLMGVSCALIYLVSNYKGFAGLFTSKRNIFYTVSTIILIVCLLGFYVFPMMYYVNTGLYNYSNSILMYTNPEYISKTAADSLWRGGFLRYNWISELINNYGMNNIYHESWSSWCGDYIMFSCTGVLALAIYLLTKKIKNNKIKTIILFFTSLIPLITLLFSNRFEMFLIVPLFCVSIFYVGLYKEDKWNKSVVKRNLLSTIKEPGVYVLFIELIFTCLLLFNKDIWFYVPSILYNAQFAFRLWSIVIMLFLMLVLIIIKPISNLKITQFILAIGVGIVFLSNMGNVDKRFCYQTSNGYFRSEPTINDIYKEKRAGWQNEYIPQVFRDGNYVSEYDNSLYTEIRYEVYGSRKYHFGLDEYITPVFLIGEGGAAIQTLNSPEATFDIFVTSETSLVQFPQFYYKGYVMEFTYNDIDYSIECENIDGLISFRLPNGDYTAELKWVGTTSYQIFKPLFYIGITGTSLLIIVPPIVSYFKKKQKYKLKITK